MENEYVTLNIEGRVVQTKVATLTSVKNSYFSEIFRGPWTKRLDQVWPGVQFYLLKPQMLNTLVQSLG